MPENVHFCYFFRDNCPLPPPSQLVGLCALPPLRTKVKEEYKYCVFLQNIFAKCMGLFLVWFCRNAGRYYKHWIASWKPKSNPWNYFADDSYILRSFFNRKQYILVICLLVSFLHWFFRHRIFVLPVKSLSAKHNTEVKIKTSKVLKNSAWLALLPITIDLIFLG